MWSASFSLLSTVIYKLNTIRITRNMVLPIKFNKSVECMMCKWQVVGTINGTISWNNFFWTKHGFFHFVPFYASRNMRLIQ